jgi:ligand-binding sensor domain-containing protein
MQLKLLGTFVLLLAPFLASSQDSFYGLPNIRNYASVEYDGHSQNWAFAEDSNGVLFFSNLQNIIRYDGVNWKKISVPNGRSYSISATNSGKVFVGGVDEFGYLDKPTSVDETVIEYFSLRNLAPDSLNIGRIFELASLEDTLYFQSGSSLLIYDGDSLQVINSKVRFSGIHIKGERVFLREALEGIYELKGTSINLIPGGEYFADKNLFGFFELGDSNFFCSSSKCLVYDGQRFEHFKTEADQYFEDNFLDEAIALQDSTIAVATRTGGVVHLSAEGEILNIIDTESGLISNTVYGVYEDRNGSVWAATVGGISRIDFGLPLRNYDERMGIEGSVYDIFKFDNYFFISSSEGIYELDQNGSVEKTEFSASCGQIKEIENELYVVCGQNLYRHSSDEYQKLTDVMALKFDKISDKDVFVLANEGAIWIGKETNNKIEPIYEIDADVSVPVSVYVDDLNQVWVGSTTSGLTKVVLQWEGDQVINHKLETYFLDIENGEDDRRVHVTDLNGEPAFLTWGKGIQTFDSESQEFNQVKRYGEFFSDTTNQFFWAEEDAEGDIWFRAAGEYQGALLQPDGSYKMYDGVLKLIDTPQSNGIYPDDNSNIWYATGDGLVSFRKNNSFNSAKPYHLQINEVLVRNDSLINRGGSPQSPVLDYSDNELRFTYAGASYYNAEETVYRVQLEGFDEDWGLWTSETQKDYTNIPEGEYSFKVQARNIFGVVSESKSFAFSVLPPWYRTWWAYLLYTFAIAGILYLVYKIRINQVLRVQRIRNNIASDLHDEVSATLSSISYFAQAIKSDAVTTDKNRFVDLIANSAGDAKEKISDIVWAINPEHDDWQGFLSKCRRFASDLLESKEIEYSLKIDEYIPGKLDMQFRQHLWLIFKEMVTNAVRHSDAKNLDVILKNEDGILKLVVQDDGQGMDVDNVKKGNGLVNIQKRVDQINGNISLKTSEGFGTRWILKVRL